MRKSAIFLAYGVTVINVLTIFGKELKALNATKAHTIVVGKMMNGRLMSATKPDHALPDVNHFVLARSKTRGTVMVESSGVLAEVLPDGSREQLPQPRRIVC